MYSMSKKKSENLKLCLVKKKKKRKQINPKAKLN